MARSIQTELVRFILTRLYPFRRGQGRLLDRTWLGRLDVGQEITTIQTSDAFEMEVLPRDHIGRHLVLTGQFDRTIVEVLLQFSSPGDRFWDIGANIGYVTCCMLKNVPQLRAVAVEPVPELFRLLQGNLARFEGRAEGVRCAISSEPGKASMVVDSVNSGRCRITETGLAGSELIEVDVLTPESLLRETSIDGVDLIKIDVEGHEVRLVPSLAPILREFRPRAVVFEYQEDVRQCPPIWETFEQNDYVLFGIRKKLLRYCLDAITPTSPRGPESRIYNDFVAVRRDIASAHGL